MNQPLSFQKKLLPQLISAVIGSLALHAAHAADEPAKTNELDKVEIRGIRATLNKNLLEKRENSSIVDSISAEDVGKFPDKNVADSLQRVPGISVDRSWGEGKAIFVRGTDKNLNMTQLNGQAVASSEWWLNEAQTRSFNYDVLPSEIVGSLDVYKSPSADLDEGSIGGLVIVKTRKPLAFKDPLTLQASAEAIYSQLPGKTDPQVSGLLNWKSADKTFGVMLALSKQTRTMRRDGLEMFDDGKYDVQPVDKNNVPTGAASTKAYAAWGGGSAIFRQDRDRTTGNLALQFQPNQQTDIVLNYMNSDMKMDNSNQNYLWQASGQAVDGVIKVQNPSFITTSDGSKALVGGSIGPTNVSFEPIYRESYVKAKVLDLDGTFRSDRWTFHGQAGTTSSEGGSRHDRHFWMEGNATATIDMGLDKYDVKYDMDPLSYKGLVLKPGGGTSDRVRRMESKENYLQGDVTLDVDNGFISTVKFGGKHRDSTQQNFRSQGTANGAAASWQNLTLGDLSTGPSPLLSQAAASPGALTQYLWFDDALVASKATPMFDKNMTYADVLNEHYKIKEKISAAYVKADFSSGKWRGDFGLRFVKTQQTSNGFAQAADKTFKPISQDNNYTDTLPSLNVAYSLQKDLILRGAISKAMARQTFDVLNPGLTRDGTVLTKAKAGNPLLKPIHSNQAELGAEWYFEEGSLLSGTVFIKKLDTFNYTDTKQETINGEVLNVSRPLNADNGANIKGFELQWQQAFGRSGFGATANYTFTDAKAGAVAGQPRLQVVGNSRDQYNASVYYERDGISARVSYNYRSKSYGGMTMGGQVVNSAYGQWDASAGWDITPKVSLFASAVNLGNELVRSNTTDGLPLGIYENGRRFGIGLRAKF